MKRFLLAIIFIFMLMACSSEDNEITELKEENIETDEVANVEEKEEEEGVNESDVIKNDMGEFTILKKNKEVKEIQQVALLSYLSQVFS